MGNRIKTIVALLLAMLLVLMSIPALAEEGSELTFSDLGKKTAEALVTPGQYEVTVSVPGAVSTEKYGEIIVMVDASSSQGANLEKLKGMLVDMAKEVLHNDGSMRLTLMGFGMGPRLVGSFYNAETLESYLKNVTQSDLRQGVSATNCERALEFVYEYIEKSGKLGETVVVFTSDGMANMDETTFALSTWRDHPEWYMSGATVSMIATYAAGGQADRYLSGGRTLEATAALYPNEAIAVEMAIAQHGASSDEAKAAVEAFYAAVTSGSVDEQAAYLDATYKAVLENSGLTYSDEAMYSTSRLEKAFLEYEDGCMTNAYLCAIHGMKNASFYPDWYSLSTWGARAAASADKLANHSKVEMLYMVDFASKINTWMNPESTTAYHVTANDVTYMTSNNFDSALDKIGDLSSEFFTTLYKDTTVVDPMSKWVGLIPSSIRIYNGNTLIYKHGEGWLTDDQPTADPINLTESAEEGYTITWRIKDGPLLYSDRYSLKYVVDVDETVEGFEYGTYYPANDPTSVKYTDENGNEQTKDIKVPEVRQPADPDDIDEDEYGFRIYKGSEKDHKPIEGIKFDVYKVELEEGVVNNPIPTAEEVSKYAVDKNLITTLTTNSVGFASVNLTEKGYGEGLYLIIERDSSKVKAPVDPFYVILPTTINNEVVTVLDIYPKNVPVEEEKPPIPPVLPDEPDDDTDGKASIIKHSSADDNTLLKGAEFQVYRLAEEGETSSMTTVWNDQEIGLVPVMRDGQPVVITTDENGLATTPSLPFGLYFLVETQAPAGYNLLDNAVPVFVTISSHETANAIKIANTPGTALPETGGAGTRGFMLAGLAMFAIATVLIVRRKSYEV